MIAHAMHVVWTLALFGFILGGGFLAFLALEFLAMSSDEDEVHTLSTYIKRARRRYGLAGSVLLTLVIVLPAAWLWGHLVMEWW